MQSVDVIYKCKNYTCKLYELGDERNILDVVPAWRIYASAVKKIGKSPQVPSAFSQAFCCLYLGLADKGGDGVDAFRLDEAQQFQQAIEIKSTTTPTGRNDIRLYPKFINGRSSIDASTQVDIDFDELYWLAFCDSSLSHYDIYHILPIHIHSHDETYQPDVRGGRINVSLRQLVKNAGLDPVRSGDL